ncbi:MAG: DUF362 domain-containing protein [Candidatus Heimdallarchaeota archaeon]|nr:DUF362 domain-containing protein [Candidatus Heimdallarchaeota archaeon]
MNSIRSDVYYGSIQHGQNNKATSLKTKIDQIIDLLDFSTIKKKEKVAVKMHLGFSDGYQTIPVFFVRQVVEIIKKQGAYPFVTDNPTAVYNAYKRGYTQETVGCPIIPVAGIKDGYSYNQEINYKNVDSLEIGGAIYDADVLVNLTHSKGHGCNGYGGAIKNLALGAYAAESRWYKIHNVEQSLPYWNADECSPEEAKKIAAVCPYDAIKYNEEKHELKVAFCMCNQCMDCTKFNNGSELIEIKQENFSAFQELLAIASKHVIDTFDKDKQFYLNYLLQITPQCDCMGIAQPPVVNDIGVVGSRDIVAVDVASLDLIKEQGLIPNSIPPIFKHVNLDSAVDLHPFQRIHGPMKDPYIAMRYAAEHKMGNLEYDLIEILSPQEVAKMPKIKHQYEADPSFY